MEGSEGTVYLIKRYEAENFADPIDRRDHYHSGVTVETTQSEPGGASDMQRTKAKYTKHLGTLVI